MNEAPVLIPIQEILSNPYQVRQAEDPAVVAELAENIARNGLLQPPTVRKKQLSQGSQVSRYELAFGHTRLAAFNRLAAQEKVDPDRLPLPTEFYQMPCFVRDLDDLQMFEMAVAENIKRRDLNPIERARAMHTYMETFKKTSAETGEFFNCDETTIRGTVRLLGLPEITQAKLSSGEITIAAARQLLVLVRVAPELVEGAMHQIIEGTQPVEKVIEAILNGLAYKNKAVRMWAYWRSGKPSAGSGLWDLDMPTSQIAKFMQPLSVLGDIDIRLAKKALPGGELTVENRPQLKDWVNKLHSGLVSAEALIAQGADAETIERLDQLIHPPACTACAFHVKADNNHYCTLKACYSHKKDAWLLVELVREEKKLKIKALSVEEAHSGFVALAHSWEDVSKALFEKKDPNLRLHIKPAQYENAFTKSEVIEMVTIAPELVQAQKDEKKEKASGRSSNSWEEQNKLRRKLQEASRRFEEEAEVYSLFATPLNMIDNLGFLMAMARLDDEDLTKRNKEKILSRKEKLHLCRIEIITGLLDLEYESENEGPVATAEFLQGIAKAWGLTLPEDWLERAKAFEPETTPLSPSGDIPPNPSDLGGEGEGDAA
jgi:ParB family chromosome partitioning protein